MTDDGQTQMCALPRRGDILNTFLLAILFLAMIAAPCYIALRSSRKNEPEEIEALTVPAALSQPAGTPGHPPTLQQMAAEAEAKARVAQERARQAHWAALAAEAEAAALRADAAAEVATLAGKAAEKAIRAADARFEGGYLPENHPSLDFPRSRVRRHAA